MYHGPKTTSDTGRKTRIEIDEIKSDLATIEQSRKSLDPTIDREKIARLDKRAMVFTSRLIDLWDIEENATVQDKYLLHKMGNRTRNEIDDTKSELDSYRETIARLDERAIVRGKMIAKKMLMESRDMGIEELIRDTEEMVRDSDELLLDTAERRKTVALMDALLIKNPSIITTIVIPTYINPKDIRPDLYTIGVLGKMTVPQKERLLRDMDSIPSLTIGQTDLKKKLKRQIKATQDISGNK
jgi:hypothetical protein